jgi:hypothetical protein
MSTVFLTDRTTKTSPRLKARITGVFYLLTILAGIFAQFFVSDQLIVYGDPAATASNILNHETLFRIGFGVYLIEMACQIIMTALFYDLLRPVSKSQSLIAAFLSLAGCVIKTLSRLFFIAPLLVLDNPSGLAGFSIEQSQTLASLFFRLNNEGAGIALAFFGFYTIIKGYLIFRSTFLPKILGILGMIAGLGWLSFLYTPLAYRILPLVMMLGLLGAVLQIFWLLIFGVDEKRWKEQSARQQNLSSDQ